MMDDRFKQTYFEECEDRILEAEQGLDAMLNGALDSETINLVFRAIHSIKGGAGAFAFNTIVNFAHRFETVLDFVRENKLQPDREMCDLFLHAKDIIQGMIETEQAGQEIAPDCGQEISDALQKIIDDMDGGADAQGTDDADHASDDGGDGVLRTWAIAFRPGAEMLSTGNEPLYMIQALGDLGEVEITAELDGLPSFENLDPEVCHIGWRILLKTTEPREEIEEIFEFVSDLCELEIQMQNVPPDDMAERRKTPERRADRPPMRRKEDREIHDVAAKRGGGSIRVDLDRIDLLVNLVGEMVIAQSMLQERARWISPDVGAGLVEGIETLSRHMLDLQEGVMAVRAQAIKSVFTRIPRIIREVASACGKDVRLTTFGEETEVDKTVLETLIDPLTHMIRNSVDHGIETPQEREKAGKKPYGTIQLSAKHRSGRIIIEVQDDGAGIRRDVVLAKAISQGLVGEDENLSAAEIDNLIFKPGFSTAEKISEVSGRGVGMDVVKRNISNMGGRITVSSTPGEGCKMTLSLPLTLAVLDGMVVSVGSQRFVLPTVNIVESFRPMRQAIGELSEEVSVIRARGEYVRIVPLYDLFGIDDAVFQPEDCLLILLEDDDGQRISVMVDDVLGQQQVVIKSLEKNFRNVDGIAAATILGDGDVALILDVPGLMDMHAVLSHAEQSVARKKLANIHDVEKDRVDIGLPSESDDPDEGGADMQTIYEDSEGA